MTARERFRRLMRYEPIGRLPVLALEPFEPTALARWRTEGLPEGADPVDFLGMARFALLPLNCYPLPPFEPDVVSEDETYVVRRSAMGALVRERRDNPTLFYGHVDHPVKTRADWEAYRQRFDADSPGRTPDDWATSVAPRLNASESPVGVCFFPFFFRLGFYAMGMERFLSAFYEEPALMHDVFAHWSDFVLRLLRPLLSAVSPDFAMFGEDLAGKNGPLISPRIYEEFWRPYQTPILRMLQEHGVPVICQWTAGNLGTLLPLLLEDGFNCTWPLEVVAGMDAPGLRREFGRSLRLGGNIAKEAVIAGPDAIDRELARLTPLIREGGFLPGLDDMASPDMPFSHYRYLIERLQTLEL
jgi:uroporphyrinogen decarboxylase